MACYEECTVEEAQLVNVDQPGLVALLDYLRRRWGGMSLGIHFDRPIKGGQTPSVHSAGRALDWRYADCPDGQPSIPRSTIDNEVLPFLIDHCDQLGIQGIGDYTGPSGTQGRFWKRCRSSDGSGKGWKDQADNPDTGWGQAWAQWLHIEMDRAAAASTLTIEQRIGVEPGPTPTPPPGGTHLTGMQTIAMGRANEGNHVRVAQGLLNIRIGVGIPVDGDFGKQTDAATRQYQQVVGLAVDGIIGPATWERLGY